MRNTLAEFRIAGTPVFPIGHPPAPRIPALDPEPFARGLCLLLPCPGLPLPHCIGVAARLDPTAP